MSQLTQFTCLIQIALIILLHIACIPADLWVKRRTSLEASLLSNWLPVGVTLAAESSFLS